MKKLKLKEDNEILLVGFGTFLLSRKKCEDAVFNAIKCGYRLIDTAEAYRNEKK